MSKTVTKASVGNLLDQEQKPAALPATRKRPPPKERPPQQPQRPVTALDLLARMVDRGDNPEQLAKMMDLLERQRTAEALQGFNAAMVEFKLESQSIIKDGRAAFKAKDKDQQNGRAPAPRVDVEYSFATLGAICDAIVADLAKRGIRHKWTPEQPSSGPDANMIVVTCTLTHIMGHSESATVKFPADPSGTKNPLQSIGSGLTYGERYSLLAVCGIATKEQGDDDGHGAHASTAPQSQAAPGSSRTVSGTSGVHPIDEMQLRNAIRSIKGGDYSYGNLVAYYKLTPAQHQLVRSELNIVGDE